MTSVTQIHTADKQAVVEWEQACVRSGRLCVHCMVHMDNGMVKTITNAYTYISIWYRETYYMSCWLYDCGSTAGCVSAFHWQAGNIMPVNVLNVLCMHDARCWRHEHMLDE